MARLGDWYVNLVTDDEVACILVFAAVRVLLMRVVVCLNLVGPEAPAVFNCVSFISSCTVED